MLWHTADTFLFSPLNPIYCNQPKNPKQNHNNQTTSPCQKNKTWVNTQQYVQYVISWFRIVFQMKQIQNILQN